MTLKDKFTEWKGKAVVFYEKNKFALSVAVAGLGLALLVGIVFVLTPSDKPAVVKQTPIVKSQQIEVAVAPSVAKVQPKPKVKATAKAPHKDLIISGVEPKEVEKSVEIPQKTAPVAEKTTKYQTEDDEKTLQPDYKDSLKEYNLLSGQQ